jgi:hypothetical protein
LQPYRDFPWLHFCINRFTLKKTVKTMIVHQVFFWLHQPESDLKDVMEGCRTIGSLTSAKDYLVGIPANTPKREVIEDSYHIALTVYFDSMEDHDLYQEDAEHLKFIDDHKHKWAKVQVYDFEV